MGRHSAPDDDEVDAAPDTAYGAVAVDEDTRDAVHAGRHSSPQSEVEDDAPSAQGAPTEPVEAPAESDVAGAAADPDVDDADGPSTGGLDLIEDALAGPDSGPMPVADLPRRPAPGQPSDLHDAPTERIPTVGAGPGGSAPEQTDRIPTVAGAVTDAPTTEVPWTSSAPVDDATGSGVSEVGVDSAGPVVATPDASTARTAPRRGTIGDIALIRRHGDVRARVIAAVVVPFVLYFGVFALAGELTVRGLIWIWVPAVTAGVLVGLLLDAGHRRYPDTGPAAATELEDPTPEPRTR